MKKIASTLILSLMAATGFAQELYVNFGLGYAVPQAGQTLDGTGTPYNGSLNATTFTAAYNMKIASFTSGVNGTIGMGYLFNDHVGIQLDAAFNLSGTTYTFNNENVSYGGYQATESITQQAKTALLLMPSLVLQTGGDKPWNLYTRFGLAIPVSTRIIQDQTFYVAAVAETDDYTSKITNSFSMGFTGAMGLKYRVNDRMSVWGEVSLLSLSQFIKESNLTTVTANGYSVPLDSVSGPHTITYKKNVTVDTNQASQPTFSQPFSNLSFKVGVSFTLSKHRHSGRKDSDEYIDKSKPFRRRN